MAAYESDDGDEEGREYDYESSASESGGEEAFDGVEVKPKGELVSVMDEAARNGEEDDEDEEEEGDEGEGEEEEEKPAAVVEQGEWVMIWVLFEK